MSFLKKFVLFFNVLAALALIAGGFSIYVSPRDFWPLAFFGLLYPWMLLLNVFFVFFWIIGRLKYSLVSLVSILITYPVLKTYAAFNFSENKSEANSRTIKVMSYNVRNFDLYNWSNEGNKLRKIIDLIKEEKPDVVCFQEFFNADTGKFKTIDILQKECDLSYFSFSETVERKKYGAWGIATFSKFPIKNTGEIQFENSSLNSSLFTDLQIDSSLIRVFNAHLQSVYLSKSDYEYIEHFAQDQEVQVEHSRKIASKLKQAFLNRSSQAKKVSLEIAKSPYPVIVCGDFNDTPASYCYRSISKNLNDAFLCAGSGTGTTYFGFIPVYRIDYILADPKFSVLRFKTLCEKHSDHYPIESLISIP